LCLDQEFTEEKPSYVEGREAIEYATKKPEEKKADQDSDEEMTGVEKTKKVLTTVWSATVQGVETTSNVVSAKSKEFGEKWDNSQTGQKINLGAKVAGEKTKEIAVVGWEKTKEGISALKENETVQAVTAKTVEKTKEWSTGLWGWMKKKIGDDVAAQAPAPAAPQAPVAE